VGEVWIVDRDTVETSNLSRTPLFRASDVGKPKAEVAAQRLKSLNEGIRVRWIFGDVEWDVGLGLFRRAQVVIGAVDSRRARLRLNRMSWRVKTPYVDGAIDGATLTGRVQVIVPGKGPCLECGWYDRDYTLLEDIYPCQKGAQLGSPTFSTIAGVVGSVQAMEALRIVLGGPGGTPSGRELRWDILHHTYVETRIKRRSGCLLDHNFFITEPLKLKGCVDRLTLREFLMTAEEEIQSKVAVVELYRDVARELLCPDCEWEARILKAAGKLTDEETLCRHCGRPAEVIRFGHAISRSEIVKEFGHLPFSQIGVPPEDIVSVFTKGGKECHFELP